jgi:hypothetical protein
MYNAATDAPVLSWEGDGGRVYIEIDCIPSFTCSKTGEVTNFPLDESASIADHFIRNPDEINFEVVQTQTPMTEAINPQIGEAIMARKTVDLNVPKTRFKPRGLLLASTLIHAGVDAAVGAIGSLVGVSKTPGPRVRVLKAASDVDRINKLVDELDAAFDAVAKFELIWLGRTWSDYILVKYPYTRAAGLEAGRFQLTLKHIDIVTTKDALGLAAPFDVGMKLPISLGNQPAFDLAAFEAKVAADSLQENSGDGLLSTVTGGLL